MISLISPIIPDYDEYCQQIKEIFDDKVFSNGGKKVTELESILTQYFESNVSAFCNGTIALMSAITCLGLSGEVIVPVFTFPASFQAISLCGCTPVFCDINDYDLTIDVNRIEELITNKTCAIMGVHVYGNVCHDYAIEKIAHKHNLKVIYDAAHCFDVPDCANLGDVSMFSFHATKLFHTAEGGCLTTNNLELDKKIKIFRSFGIAGEDLYELVGLNGKMSELNAAMGILNFQLFQKEIQKRKKNRKIYENLLYIISKVAVVPSTYGSTSYFVIRVENGKRNDVYNSLKNQGIITRKYFYPLLTNNGLYETKSDLRVSNRVSEEVLALPIQGNLTENDIELVCKIIKEVVFNG